MDRERKDKSAQFSKQHGLMPHSESTCLGEEMTQNSPCQGRDKQPGPAKPWLLEDTRRRRMEAIETEIVEQINCSLQSGLNYSGEEIIDCANKYLTGHAGLTDSLSTLTNVWWELGLRLGVADSVVDYFWLRNKLKFADIAVLALSVRTERKLRSHGVNTVNQLMHLSDQELITLPGLGEKSLREIKESLRNL